MALSKKGIRALGIAESFRKDEERSILAGVVMKGDMQIDGFGITSITVGGMDATDGIIRLFDGMKREDINVMILNGCVISLFNVIDIDHLFDLLDIPIICVTYEESAGLKEHFMRFDDWKDRLEVYNRLGDRTRMRLKTGYDIFVRFDGMTDKDAQRLLNRFTTHGKLPEPIRVAKILAKTILLGGWARCDSNA